MKVERRSILFLLIFILAPKPELFCQEAKGFKLDAVTDISLGLSGAALFAAGMFLSTDAFPAGSDWNWPDEGLIFPRSEALDLAGKVFCLAGAAGLLFIPEDFSSEKIFKVVLPYAEAFLITHGCKDILKSIFLRPRPNNSQWPEEEKYLSFPSGHTSLAFMTAAYSVYMYDDSKPGRAPKWLFALGEFGTAVLTGIFRVASGSHYISDAAVGALLGTAVGLLVPWLHSL